MTLLAVVLAVAGPVVYGALWVRMRRAPAPPAPAAPQERPVPT